MCGIAGIVGSKLSRDELEKVLRVMQRDLYHRGPDDHGLFISRNAAAGLVSTRLAILDLTAAGHQPMKSRDERFTIAYNGEVYNFGPLREQLAAAGESFLSDSDTEVILKLYARHGSECVQKLAGMFAIAIWDEQEQSLFLARDPLGIKPLYYYSTGEQLLFASELRTLLNGGGLPRRPCVAALSGYLRSGSVPEPYTLVEGIQMVPAGHYLIAGKGQRSPTKFWDIQFCDDSMTNEEAVQLTRCALRDSVERHHVSDVPVGVFLSGGIDSTAIVALSAQMAKGDLRTFSISFDDPRFDEGPVAKRSAAHFGARHFDWRLDAGTAKSLLGEFLQRSDQPSIDGFNSFCVAKLAHDQGLKVVLSGLGGDEIFGGYQSFRMIPRMLRASERMELLPPVRKLAAKALQTRFSSSRSNRLGYFLQGEATTVAAYSAMRGIFTAAEVACLLPYYGSHASDQSQPAKDAPLPSQPTLEDDISYLEITHYMRNQLLRDSDVMSMAWSLELRVPFVDVKLIDSISRVPAALRLARGKELLLAAVPEIPEWVRNRPKQGFTFPFQEWVTCEWKDVFDRISAASPVRLKSWYRTWCLFALESFLQRNQIDSPGLVNLSAAEK